MQSTRRKVMTQTINRLFFTALFGLAGSIMTVGLAAAEDQPESPLRSELRAFVVETREDGEEEFTPAEMVGPGEIIEYRLHYENISDTALTEIMALGPIAEPTDYVPDSATATLLMTPQFSIDQGSTFQVEPVVYRVELADGTVEEREATPDMYTHVRWHIAELKPQATTELRYRVRVR